MSLNRDRLRTGPVILLLAWMASAGILAGDRPAIDQETLAIGGGSGMTGVVALEQGGIQVIDGVTQSLSPVLLQNELGYDVPTLLRRRNLLTDVAITPNASTALISSRYQAKVYFVSLLNPRAPVVLGSAGTGWYPGDIAITGDGKWALVASESHRDLGPQISVINIATRRIVSTLRLSDANIGAVAVSPDGKTVLCTDDWNSEVHVMRMNPSTGGLSYVKGITLGGYYAPVNIAISPDGRTALTANMEMPGLQSKAPEGGDQTDIPRPESHVSVFRIDGPGQVLLTGHIPLDEGHKPVQGVAFSRTGTRAFCIASREEEESSQSSTKVCYDPEPYSEVEIDVLAVTGPGQAAATGISIPLPWSEFYHRALSMDTLAVDPVDNYLYVTIQNDYYDDKIDLSPYVAVISLRTYQVVDVLESPLVPFDRGYRYFIPKGIAFRENYRPMNLLYRPIP